MRRRPCVLLLAALLLGACGSITGSFRNSGSDAFRGDVLSRYTHYSDEGNPWSASSDTLRGDGRGIQSVLIRNGVKLDNGYVEVDASNVDDGGLVLRFLDNEHYYLLAIRDDAAPPPRDFDNLQIYRRDGPGPGGFTSIFRTNVSWPRGTTRRIRFSVNGSTFTVSMDGIVVGAVTELTATEGSGFGVRHYGAGPAWKNRYQNLSWRIGVQLSSSIE